MKLSGLGEISMSLVPKPDDAEIYSVSIGAHNRKDVINAETRKDETVDQFCMRLKGILRALLQSEPRDLPVNLPDEKQVFTWEQQKTAIKGAK